GHASAVGTIEMGSPVAFHVSGQVANLDLRNLPRQLNAPSAPSNLQFAYSLAGRGPALSGDVRMDQSTIADATLAKGATASFAISNGAPTFAAEGQVANLDVQKVASAFDIGALSAEKFRSHIDTAFEVKGSGGGGYPLTLDASGKAVDAQIFGASVPRFEFNANIAGGDAQVTASGQFDRLDPSVVAGDKRLAGRVGGSLDAKVTVRQYANGVTADSLDVSGRVSMDRSTINGIDVESAVVDGTYANGAGTLNQLEVESPDLHVSARGPVALNDTGSSDLSLHVDSPSLDRLGRLVGQTLTGSVSIDGAVTGNARELNAQGTLKGGNLGQGDNSALTLDI